MTRHAILLILLGGLALAACGTAAPTAARSEPPSAPPQAPTPLPGSGAPLVNVTTDKHAYRVGESIVVTIHNASTTPIQFIENCSLNLCQQSGTDWICEERECDGPPVTVQAGDQLGLVLPARSATLTPGMPESSMRFKLDHQIVAQDPYYFAPSNEFAITSQKPDCAEARQVTLDHAQSSAYAGTLDLNRVLVTWQPADQTCLVDVASQGAGQIRPGLWSEGYAVTVAARTGRVQQADAYER